MDQHKYTNLNQTNRKSH